MKSCFFIGHREASTEIFPILTEAVELHIAQFGVREFIVGNYGGFDRMAAKAVIASKAQYLVSIFSGWNTKDQKLDIRPFRELQNEKRFTAGNYICNLRELRAEVNGITYYRMMHNLSQIDLAETLNIPPASLCKYELGENVCPVTVYQKLGAFFRVPIDDLLESYPSPNLT